MVSVITPPRVACNCKKPAFSMQTLIPLNGDMCTTKKIPASQSKKKYISSYFSLGSQKPKTKPKFNCDFNLCYQVPYKLCMYL